MHPDRLDMMTLLTPSQPSEPLTAGVCIFDKAVTGDTTAATDGCHMV
jgi:hypothetical protein